MRIGDVANWIIAITGGWIAVSFAYVFGLFFAKSSSFYMGLLRLEDVILGAFPLVSFIICLQIPLIALVFWTQPWSSRAYRSVKIQFLILGISFAWSASLMAYLTIISLTQNLWPVYLIGIAVITLAWNVTHEIDHRLGGARARACGSFLSAVLLSFMAGSVPRPPWVQPVTCDEVYFEGSLVHSGDLVFSSSAGLFLKTPGERGLVFIPDEAFDRLRGVPCADERH